MRKKKAEEEEQRKAEEEEQRLNQRRENHKKNDMEIQLHDNPSDRDNVANTDDLHLNIPVVGGEVMRHSDSQAHEIR